jgi:hypothetical protein
MAKMRLEPSERTQLKGACFDLLTEFDLDPARRELRCRPT